MKICASCKQEKNVSEFNSWSLAKDHLNSRCRQCTRVYNNDYYHDNGKENQKEYRRNYRLLYYYKITFKQYSEMFVKQQGKCLGCDKEFESLSVDHDHETGKVRGLLCSACNFLLGRIENNPEILDRLSDYLKVKT